MATSGSLIRVDPDGDLFLKVGEGEAEVTYVVCSKTLARSCRFFKTLLYGEFAESKNQLQEGAEWTVSLPDDGPEAMYTILCILHTKFNYVPEHTNPVDLYGITVLTDKYDLTHILRPWAKVWAKDMLRYVSIFRKHVTMRIWIAWELGDEPLFKEMVQRLVFNIDARAADGELYEDGTLQPTGFLDFIRAARLEKISEILSGAQELFNFLNTTDSRACRIQSEECATTLRTGMTMSLQRERLFPLPEANEVRQGIRRLRENLVSLDLTGSGHYPPCSYTRNLVEHALQVVGNGVALQEPFLQHLRSQAEKTGLLFDPQG
ncbi:hypothetical protein F5Y05DRAFT_410939 [Hypoxylon sp. FL0543]|nr:hypothetical protein F5Y05DRAFT_410939 [Hypoxylon sp. FL0543]